ncbi:MAG: hypothetical protein LBD64_06890 [Odoribacteraceae bacterium]|nr:hypothetical protein [Odoribacteraceae bacterium]
MESFLHLLARDVVRDAHPESLTIVFPNKRAGLFLSRELARMIDRPAWMPVIVTLEEFVERYVGLKRADEITLLVKLYSSYRECSGSKESFDDFYPWGSMLLEDFDDVDKYLVDARDLFSNLRALREIEKLFPYLTEAQVEHVRRFWSHFRDGVTGGREQEAFLETWGKLYPTYCHFREKLQREGLCYEGMGTRLLRDRVDEVPRQERLFFAGFNALNKCEEQIFARFRDSGQAAFYWDHDLYYTSNERHEAGLFLRDNLKRFPNALGIEHFNNFRREEKRVEHVTVSSSSGQAKLLPSLLGELPPDPSETAIVLCDENLLSPVLHSIPPTVEKINITMGYPARKTAAAALLTLAGDLQRGAKRVGEECYYARETVIALLDHPLVQAGDPVEARKVARGVHSSNLTHVPSAMLLFDEVTRALFAPRDSSFDYFLDVIARLLAREDAGTGAIERETLFALYKWLQQARDSFRE